MTQLNYNNKAFLANVELGEDYVDTMIRYLQAMALPSYKVSQVTSAISQGKIVNPPVVAVRFGNEIFIKGVVNGDVSVTYGGPINKDNKY